MRVGWLGPSLVSFALLASPCLGAVAPDWFASLYTSDGVEIRQDEGIFTLFALLNSTGFDSGQVTRALPFPKVEFGPVRNRVRAAVLGGDSGTRKMVEAFLDAHPVELNRYLSYVLQDGAAPLTPSEQSERMAANSTSELKGLDAVLQQVSTNFKIPTLLTASQSDFRTAAKAYLPLLDTPLSKSRKLMKSPVDTQVRVELNLLDEPGAVRSARGLRGEFVIVLGPSEKPNIEGVVREFARLNLESVMSKTIQTWAAGPVILKEAQALGAKESNVRDYVLSLLASAVALRALEAPESAVRSASSKGYFGMGEVGGLFDEGKPMDVLVVEALQKIETRRQVRK
jgi:hypothetical protein